MTAIGVGGKSMDEALAETGEIIGAGQDGRIVGAVARIGPAIHGVRRGVGLKDLGLS